MRNDKPSVSIIIPVKEINDYIRESIPHILNLDYENYEILVLPDIGSDEKFEKTRIIPTGKISPAGKRDLAIKYAEGEILAFLDDDAYPREDWLKNAVRHFENSKIMAVGGPAVTPNNDSFWQKVSGAVFLSRLSGGNPERYWPVGKVKEIDDWPSVNLLVRKSDFSAVNGFDCQFWPGEDTKLCFDLIKKINKKIIYDPNVLVFHHRRAGLKKHLKQVGNYGIHRGFFAKKYPENSFKLKYFIPSLFLLFVVIGVVLSIFNKIILGLYLMGLGIYLLALIKAIFDIRRYEKNLLIAANAVYYIFLTHLVYGFNFLKGLIFVKNLKSKLR